METTRKEIVKLEQDYEAGVRTKNASQLTAVLAAIKKEQAALKTVRAQIEVHTESEHSGVSFYERIMLECLHIRTGIFADTLKAVAQEILGQQNGMFEFVGT